MKIFKKIIGILTSIILVFVMSYALVSFFAPNYVTKIYGFELSRVVSNSMEPKIKVNDMVIATSVNDGFIFKASTKVEDLKDGDIIIFYTYIDNKRVKVTHYFEKINDGYVRTYRINSDNIRVYDKWYKNGQEYRVLPEDIIGKVNYILPTNVFIRFVFSWYGLIAFLCLILAGFFLSLFRKEQEKEEDFDYFLDPCDEAKFKKKTNGKDSQ